jgi:hypothetical protein
MMTSAPRFKLNLRFEGLEVAACDMLDHSPSSFVCWVVHLLPRHHHLLLLLLLTEAGVAPQHLACWLLRG